MYKRCLERQSSSDRTVSGRKRNIISMKRKEKCQTIEQTRKKIAKQIRNDLNLTNCRRRHYQMLSTANSFSWLNFNVRTEFDNK